MMPIYVYRDLTTGAHVEVHMSMDEMQDRQDELGQIDLPTGNVGQRDLRAEHLGFRDTPGAWPKEAVLAGVHPSQIAEAQELDRKNGVPTEYVTEGRNAGAPIWRDRAHRNNWLRAHTLYDRDAGYGDAQPGESIRSRRYGRD